MKMFTRMSVSLFLAGAVLFVASSTAHAQQTVGHQIGTTSAQPLRAPDLSQVKPYFTVKPLKDAAAKAAEIRLQSSSNTTIPLWGYSVTSPLDSQTYTGQMVGRTPYFHGHRSTAIKTYLVPVSLTFLDTNTTFNPTAANTCLGNQNVFTLTKNSPVFQNVDWTMNGLNIGTGQYVDAFQRANFWAYVAGTPYHTTLDVTTLPVQGVQIGTSAGVTGTGNCGTIGYLDMNAWDSYAQNTLIPSLAAQGVGPNTLPIFVFDSVVMYGNGNINDCCILGYHGSYTPNGVLQTYSIMEFDASGTFYPDIAPGSHEVGEWMNDPDGSNLTPAWGKIGQQTSCQNNLEVGDPLSGSSIAVTLNGFTYHPQELAFFSWFFRLSPSFGAGGYYSNNVTFTTSQNVVCQ